MIYPVFSIVPDFTDPPEYSIITASERVNLAPAEDVAFFPQTQADRLFAFDFTLTTAADIRELKAFFRDRCGRNAPFYLPGWRNDLPAVSGTIGENLLTVTAPDFSLGEHSDDRTRAIYIWQPGQALFTSEVIAATPVSGDEVELNLVTFLTFTVDPETAIVGYLYIVRCDEDELQYDHLSATVATVPVKFRTVRQWIDAENTYSVARLDITGGEATALGFVSAEASPEEGEPRDPRIADADGSAAWVNPDGIRVKVTATPEDIVIPDGTGSISALTPAPVLVEHLSLTFDPDGGHMLAWNISATQFRLARDPSDPIFTDFDGLDPLLSSNLTVDETISSGDQTNFLYYRKPADNRLYLRKGTGFGTESVAAVLPVRPVKLQRIYKDGRTLKIEFLDAGMRVVVLTSAAYPEA